MSSAVSAEQATVARPIAASAANAPVHAIEPWRSSARRQIHEVWVWRRLLPFYGKQYLLRRVRNTWLGWIWIPLRPGIDILSRTLLFHQVLGAPSGDRPYFIFIAFGQSGWVVFHSVNHWGTRAMRMSQSVLKNAYVPRLPRLTAVLVPAALDFLLNIIVALVAILYYLAARGILYLHPSGQTLTGLGGILLMAAWGIVIGLFTSPWSAYTRDIRYSFNYVVQFWYIITPVALPLSHYHGWIRTVAEVNPITAPIMLIQWGFLDSGFPPMISLVTSFGSLAVLSFLGLWTFSRFESAAVARL
jgi:lipopolysaccharide transport system permease protein